jgi:hypothetical protein
MIRKIKTKNIKLVSLKFQNLFNLTNVLNKQKNNFFYYLTVSYIF